MSLSIPLITESSSSALDAQGLRKFQDVLICKFCLHYHQHPSSLLFYCLLSKFSSVHSAMTLQSLCPSCGFSKMWIVDGGSCIRWGNALLHTLEEIQTPKEVSKVRTSLQLPLEKGLKVCTSMWVFIPCSLVNCGGYKPVWMISGSHLVPMLYLVKLNYTWAIFLVYLWGFFFPSS